MKIATAMPGIDCRLMLQSTETNKIVSQDMHPKFPWVVTAHENNNAVLWDYQEQRIVSSIFPSDIDDTLRESLFQQRAAERSSEYRGPKDAEQQLKALEKSKVGAIKSVRFFDRDTQKVIYSLRQRIRRHKEMDSSALPPPVTRPAPSPPVGDKHPSFQRARTPTLLAAESKRFQKERKQECDFYDCNFVILVFEHRVVLWDYVTQEKAEIRLSDLENKPQASVAPVGVGPVLAFGGADGFIRLYNVETRTMVKKFPCGKAAVDMIFGFDDTSGKKIIVNTSSGGSVQWWVDVENLPGDGSDKPTTQQSHGGEIVSMAINTMALQVLTASTDKSVAVWDLPSARELMRLKPKTKQVYYDIASFEHGRFPMNSLLVMGKDDSKIYLLYPEEDKNTSLELLDVNEFPNSMKKNKILSVTVHPTRPDIVCCVTRMGLCIITLAQLSSPSFSVFPTCDRNTRLFFPLHGRISVFELEGSERKKTLDHPSITGQKRISLSYDGRYLGVLGVDTQQFQVMDVNSTPWRVVDEGKALDFVWAGKNFPNRYALLAPPAPTVDDISNKRKKRSTKKSSESITKAVPLVVIKELDNNDYAMPIVEDVPVKFPVTRFFPGTLLGVAYHPDDNQMTKRMANRLTSVVATTPRASPTPSTGTLRGASRARHGTVSVTLGMTGKPPPAVAPVIVTDTEYLNKCFGFLTWDGVAIGEELPLPTDVCWDPEQRYCTMIYESHFLVFEVRPTFTLICRINEPAVHSLWHSSCVLFYSTATHVKCLFPRVPDMTPVVLASKDSVEAEYISLYHGTNHLINHLLPSSLCGITHCDGKSVFVVDSMGMSHEISISSPRMNMYISATAGIPDVALQHAKEIAPEDHEDIAHFLDSLGYGEYAIRLSDVPPLLKFKLAVYSGQFDVVLPSLSAAIESAQDDEAKQELASLCVQVTEHLSQSSENVDLVGGILRRMANGIDENAYLSLTLHFVKSKDVLSLRTLFDSLLLDEKWEMAKFASIFIGDSAVVKSCCEQGSNYADAVAFFHGTEDEKELQEKHSAQVMQLQEMYYRKSTA